VPRQCSTHFAEGNVLFTVSTLYVFELQHDMKSMSCNFQEKSDCER